MKEIASKRTKGEWKADFPTYPYKTKEDLDRVTAQMEADDKFIAMASNQWDKLMELAAAVEQEIKEQDFDPNERNWHLYDAYKALENE